MPFRVFSYHVLFLFFESILWGGLGFTTNCILFHRNHVPRGRSILGSCIRCRCMLGRWSSSLGIYPVLSVQVDHSTIFGLRSACLAGFTVRNCPLGSKIWVSSSASWIFQCQSGEISWFHHSFPVWPFFFFFFSLSSGSPWSIPSGIH